MLSGPDGAPIPGSLERSADGLTLSFTPESPLSHSTVYTAHAQLCGIYPSDWSFQTSELEPPLNTDLTGRTYALDLSSARMLSPEGVGPLISNFVEVDILLQIRERSPGGLTFLGALTEPSGQSQDLCQPTFALPLADFAEDPYFEIGPQDVGIPLSAGMIPIRDMTVSGAFAPDGHYFGGGTLGGVLDMRDLAPLLVEAGVLKEPSMEGACALLVGFGVDCAACPEDGALGCVVLEADTIVAEWRSGLELTPIEEPSCE